jgi:hypothetical protein
LAIPVSCPWWHRSPSVLNSSRKKISNTVKTYWHDHSLESSDGTINMSIQPFPGKKNFLNFSQKTSHVLNEFKKCKTQLSPVANIWQDTSIIDTQL